MNIKSAKNNIKVIVNPGTEFDTALTEAFMIAGMLKCNVTFKFNGVQITINSATDISKIKWMKF